MLKENSVVKREAFPDAGEKKRKKQRRKRKEGSHERRRRNEEGKKRGVRREDPPLTRGKQKALRTILRNTRTILQKSEGNTRYAHQARPVYPHGPAPPEN